MKIVHIAPNAPYNDYWGYQENLLPKYQKKMGHEVSVITTNMTHSDGKIVEIETGDYKLRDGEHIYRLERKKYRSKLYTSLSARLDIYDLLVDLSPDFIFFHGLVSQTIFDAIKYKKKNNAKCVIVQDNHLDFNIGRGMKTIKDIIIMSYHRLINLISIRYVDKVYGVTPWRKEYAEKYFGIPSYKTDVLIMGADDDKMELSERNDLRSSVRKLYSVQENEFLIVSGGKIDARKNIHVLMEACSKYKECKLLVFGKICEDVKDIFDCLVKNSPNIIYVGWISSEDVYKFYYAADLIFFPGQHSVLWEQACASKTPCVFERWYGMEHVNNGGNSDFIDSISVDSILNKIKELHFTSEYYDMKKKAESDNSDIYLYSNIAKKSLECVYTNF